MFPSKLLFVQFIRLYSVALSAVGPSSNGSATRLFPLKRGHLHGWSQLLKSKVSHRFIASNTKNSSSSSSSSKESGGWCFSLPWGNNHHYGYYRTGTNTIRCYAINWRAFICAVTLFLWDRERVTNTEIERCYNRYKRQYLQGKDGQEEEEEEERCPAVIPSHEVSTNSIEGAFIEREEKRKENGGKGGISSSSFLRKRKEESSAEDDSSERVRSSSSSAHTSNDSAHSTDDSAPDDVIPISVVKKIKENKNGIDVWSKLTSGYTYLKSLFTSTVVESDPSLMDEGKRRVIIEPIPLEVTEVVSEDESILGGDSINYVTSISSSKRSDTNNKGSTANGSTGANKVNGTTTSNKGNGTTSKGNGITSSNKCNGFSSQVEGASDEIIESPWKAVKGSKSTPEEDIKREGWEFMLEQGGCKVYFKPYKDTGLCQYRVIGHYEDITARDFLDVQTDNEYRKVWDTYALKLYTVDTDSKTGTEVIYWLLKYPFPMSSRDYVFVRRAWISSNDDAIVIINRSIEHPSYPESKKYVRVKSYFSEMVIKPNTFIDELGFHYDLTYFDDPGTYMPSSAVSWVSKSAMPDFLNKMHTAAQRKSSSSYSQQQQHKGAV